MAKKLCWPLNNEHTTTTQTNLNSSVAFMLTCLSSSFTSYYSLDHALNNFHDLLKSCPF